MANDITDLMGISSGMQAYPSDIGSVLSGLLAGGIAGDKARKDQEAKISEQTLKMNEYLRNLYKDQADIKAKQDESANKLADNARQDKIATETMRHNKEAEKAAMARIASTQSYMAAMFGNKKDASGLSTKDLIDGMNKVNTAMQNIGITKMLNKDNPEMINNLSGLEGTYTVMQKQLGDEFMKRSSGGMLTPKTVNNTGMVVRQSASIPQGVTPQPAPISQPQGASPSAPVVAQEINPDGSPGASHVFKTGMAGIQQAMKAGYKLKVIGPAQ